MLLYTYRDGVCVVLAAGRAQKLLGQLWTSVYTYYNGVNVGLATG